MTAAEQDESGPIPFDDTHPSIDSETLALINRRFDRGRERMRLLEASVGELRGEVRTNTELTIAGNLEMKKNTEIQAEINEVFQVAKSGVLALAKFGRGLAMIGRWLMRTIKWLTPLAVAYVAIKHDLSELLRAFVDLFRKH